MEFTEIISEYFEVLLYSDDKEKPNSVDMLIKERLLIKMSKDLGIREDN
jgi:hypothetical protein